MTRIEQNHNTDSGCDRWRWNVAPALQPRKPSSVLFARTSKWCRYAGLCCYALPSMGDHGFIKGNHGNHGFLSREIMEIMTWFVLPFKCTKSLYSIHCMYMSYLFVILVIANGQILLHEAWTKAQKLGLILVMLSLLHVPTLRLKSRGLLLSKRCTSAHHNLAFHTNPGSSYSFKQVTMSNS